MKQRSRRWCDLINLAGIGVGKWNEMKAQRETTTHKQIQVQMKNTTITREKKNSIHRTMAGAQARANGKRNRKIRFPTEIALIRSRSCSVNCWRNHCSPERLTVLQRFFGFSKMDTLRKELASQRVARTKQKWWNHTGNGFVRPERSGLGFGWSD